MNILDLLRADGSIVINKSLAKLIGLNETIILAELISLYLFYQKNEKLDQEEYFYCTIDKLEENTTLTKNQQGPAIKRLENLGLLTTKLKGLPATRHFKINYNSIEKIFAGNKLDENKKLNTTNGSERVTKKEQHANPTDEQFAGNQQTGLLEISKQDCWKSATINNNNNIKYNNNINNLSIYHSDNIVSYIAKLRENDRLNDNNINNILELLEIHKTHKQFTDHIFITTLEAVIKYNPNNFKSYLNKALLQALNNIYIQPNTHTVSTNADNTDNENLDDIDILHKDVSKKSNKLPRFMIRSILLDKIMDVKKIEYDQAEKILIEKNYKGISTDFL